MIAIETVREWILDEVSKERDWQLELFKAGEIEWDCSDPDTAIKDKIATLAEEFSEFVCELRAVMDGDASAIHKAKTEGRQLAAVAVAILESLEGAR